MGTQVIIEPLDGQKHNRAAFSCGVESLDRYLLTQATQDAGRGVASPYVLIDMSTSAILGYYTISTASIELTRLPHHIARRLPRHPSVPAMLIGRLAVDQHQQGRRLGERLLIDALRKCYRLSRELAATAVIVDALDEKAAQFYARYGFQPFEDKPLNLFIPMKAIQSLVEPPALSATSSPTLETPSGLIDPDSTP